MLVEITVARHAHYPYDGAGNPPCAPERQLALAAASVRAADVSDAEDEDDQDDGGDTDDHQDGGAGDGDGIAGSCQDEPSAETLAEYVDPFRDAVADTTDE